MPRLVFNFRFLVSALALISAGCHRAERQYEAETDTIRGIVRLLEMYTYEHPGIRITNLPQVFITAEQGYPHRWHNRFQAFGKQAGFTNSFYEKYVFFPPGITNPWMKGELLLMNAQPYPGPEHSLLRNVVARDGNRYLRQPFTEQEIQRFLKESAVAEPKPVPMPRPPPEPPPADAAFRKTAEKDLSDAMAEYERRYPTPIWRKPQWQAVGAVLAMAILGAIVWWSRRRRRH